MDEHRIKATEFTVESLKLIVTITTLFFAALLAYGTNRSNANAQVWYYTGLTLLAVSAIASVANIHSLINKLYRGEDDAIMQKEAKRINVIVLLALIAGLFSSALFISKEKNQLTDTIKNDHIKKIIVYFEHDKWDITTSGILKIDEVVKDNLNSLSDIKLLSYTDSTGKSAYNFNLSRKRSNKIRNILLSKGISKKRILELYFGEYDMHIVTANSVKEPENRCVVISYKIKNKRGK